jgi:hypothetical protein
VEFFSGKSFGCKQEKTRHGFRKTSQPHGLATGRMARKELKGV